MLPDQSRQSTAAIIEVFSLTACLLRLDVDQAIRIEQPGPLSAQSSQNPRRDRRCHWITRQLDLGVGAIDMLPTRA